VVDAAPAVVFALYSEDGAQEALATLRELLRGMLNQLHPAVKMNHVAIEPSLPAGDRITGSIWKTWGRSRSSDAQDQRRRLLRAVATAIARGKVVVFHVDADATWTDPPAGENLRNHWPRFRTDVLATFGPEARGTCPRTPSELDDLLILVMPFYEVESWTFANTTHLRRILTSAKDLAEMAKWADDLAALDRIEHIKDRLSIGGRYNLELVQPRHGFPAETLAQSSGSYAMTLSSLHRSRAVQRGLAEAADRPY
jgi:hypothetical protein